MRFFTAVQLKNGKMLTIRNGTEADGTAVYDLFNQTHAQTDYLLSYPEENSFDPVGEGLFLKQAEESPEKAKLLAEIDGIPVGIAGVNAVGTKFKVRHRAELGISVLREYWGMGIGSALMAACLECARTAGYTQIELDVVADNERAIALYENFGFSVFGRNPKGFFSRQSGSYQELAYMKKELK